MSYHELTQVPVQSWPLSSLVPGVLKDFDLPDCHRLLRAKKRLALVRPWDSQMRPRRAGPRGRSGIRARHVSAIDLRIAEAT